MQSIILHPISGYKATEEQLPFLNYTKIESIPKKLEPIQNNGQQPGDLINSIRENLLPKEGWLDYIILDAFLEVLQKDNPMFEPLSVVLSQRTQQEAVEAVRDNQVDIQIFGGTEDFQHWHCLYYDGNTLHIYDSIADNRCISELGSEEREYIEKRYPSVEVSGILFEKCQEQPDNDSCGVFAAAYATTLALGHNPSDRTYQLDRGSRTTLNIRMAVLAFVYIHVAATSSRIDEDSGT